MDWLHRFESHVKTPLGFVLMLSSTAFAVWAVCCPGASYRCSGSHATILDQLLNRPLFLLMSISRVMPANTFNYCKLCTLNACFGSKGYSDNPSKRQILAFNASSTAYPARYTQPS